MPMIDLTAPKGALADDAKAALLERLTATVAKWEGLEGNERAAQTIWASLDERDPSTMTVGGKRAERPHYRLRLTVVEGALDDESKNGLVADATRAILAAEGAPDDPPEALRVWCHIEELPDGNWGAAGRVWRLHEISKLVGVEFPGMRTEPAGVQ